MAFYKCSKCQEVWQYPIKTCPKCLIEVEELVADKAKIISISKVDIPSLVHPQTPYYILILEDENGNKWPYKSSKEYKIGEDFKIENSTNKEAVAVWRVKYDFLESIKKLIELLRGLNLNKDSKVLILPTLISPNHAYFRENTSPEFLSAILDILSMSGVKMENIKIGTQSFDAVLIDASAQKSGLLDVCLKRKIVPIDLAKSVFIKKGNLEISEEVINADLVLNLSMFKIGKSSSVDNIFKILKSENYSGLKYLSSDKDIINELNNSLENILTLGEAEMVQKPNKLITFMGLILAGRNALNVDRVFNEITMARQLPEVVKDIKIEVIPVVGRSIEEVKHDAELF